ncbi:hypothetical protein Golax_010497 [Gossypium laxum]|uniref:Aminotransferase-like plant mobile domain-containing protein n=1 Tax=Gossypium laxum TaxID=34288 RepID=A0A7J8ZI37_9ROSI|nr:hypothetical protein [Gossypium laxum]
MHTFHLPCGECIITLEDMKLQLGLLVDGSIVIWSIQSVDWETVCYDLLGVVPQMIHGEELANLFGGPPCWDIVLRDVSGDETRKNQNWWLPFTITIMGLVSL